MQADNNAGLWIEGEIPKHPFFDETKKMHAIINDIKFELSHYVVEGIKKFRHELSIGESLFNTLENQPLCWEIAIKTLCYGVIYWISRSEAKKYVDFVKHNASSINCIADFLTEDQRYNRILNYAIHSFIINRKNVCFANELIPKRAFYSVNNNTLYVRHEDFIQKSPIDSFAENKALFDYHDFAHLVTSSLCSELYGSYYFSHLLFIPDSLRQLIKSPNLNTVRAIPYSDGVVFSEILTEMFNNLDYSYLSNHEIVVIMSNMLALYYLKKASFLHPSTKNLLHGSMPISIVQLAVLTQNKAYELPASEIEQQIFTRGGKNGIDPLSSMTPSERIEFLATTQKWLYFEMRNTLKHRAHKRAYLNVARYLYNNSNLNQIEKHTLKEIINHIDYSDFKQGKRTNLWEKFTEQQDQHLVSIM